MQKSISIKVPKLRRGRINGCLALAVALCGLMAASGAEKTMKILRSATTTNDTWVAEIGGLDEGDTLVFDTSDLDVGGGYPVSFGDVTTPRLAGIRVTGHACGLNLSHIAFKLADGSEIDIGASFRVVIKNTSINFPRRHQEHLHQLRRDAARANPQDRCGIPSVGIDRERRAALDA